jgi:mRNA interferase MazF
LEINRGAIVIVAGRVTFSTEPRPAVVVQANFLIQTHPTILLAPMTSELLNVPLIRIGLDPRPENGLRVRSEIMADRLITVRRQQIDRVIGQLDPDNLLLLERALFVVLGLA